MSWPSPNPTSKPKMDFDFDSGDVEKFRAQQQLMIRIFVLFTQNPFEFNVCGRILERIKRIKIVQQVKHLLGEEKAIKADSLAACLIEKGFLQISDRNLVEFVAASVNKPEGDDSIDIDDSLNGTVEDSDDSISFHPAISSTPREDLQQKRKIPGSPNYSAMTTPKKARAEVKNFTRRIMQPALICPKTRLLQKRIFMLFTYKFNYEEGSVLEKIQTMILNRVECLVLQQRGDIAESIASTLSKVRKDLPEISHEELLEFVYGELEDPDPTWGLPALTAPGKVRISNLLQPCDPESSNSAVEVSHEEALSVEPRCEVEKLEPPGEVEIDYSAILELKKSGLSSSLAPENLSIFEELFRWRKWHAGRTRIDPLSIIGMEKLVELANARPRTQAGVKKIIGTSKVPVASTIFQRLIVRHVQNFSGQVCANCSQHGHPSEICPFDIKRKSESESEIEAVIEAICPVDPIEPQSDVQVKRPESALGEMLACLPKQNGETDSNGNCMAFTDMVQDDNGEGPKMTQSPVELFPLLAAKLDDRVSWKTKDLNTSSSGLTMNSRQEVTIVPPDYSAAIKELWGSDRSSAPEEHSQPPQPGKSKPTGEWKERFYTYRENPPSPKDEQ